MACGCNARNTGDFGGGGMRRTVMASAAPSADIMAVGPIISSWGVGRHRSICPGGCLKLSGGVYRCSAISAGWSSAQDPYCPYK